MITDKDITKLKKVFVTKDEMEMAFEKNTAIIVKEILTVVEMIGEMSNKLDKKITDHDDILDHHQIQIDNLNDKVFPTA
ncbi:MAG: hypothetical protein Q8P72_01455 [Candidatus Roizmanbacteria bacterium]|nr:hypothetical protein [Candidatus Roizmanbacteria bacterium]